MVQILHLCLSTVRADFTQDHNAASEYESLSLIVGLYVKRKPLRRLPRKSVTENQLHAFNGKYSVKKCDSLLHSSEVRDFKIKKANST